MTTFTFGYEIRDRIERRNIRDWHPVTPSWAPSNRSYIEGFDLDRDDKRIFRVDKIVCATRATHAATDPVPDEELRF